MNYSSGFICDEYELVLPDFRVDFHRDRPKWEKGRLESCAELMRPGMCIYDIGAEHGDFTALYRKWVGVQGEVIPVEPSPHYWPFIRGTFDANGFKSPAGSYVGLIADRNVGRRPIDLTWPKESEGEGIPDGGFTHLRSNPQHDQLTIDDLAIFIKPHAIVLDIEGAEWHALNGARTVLEKARPLIWVSVHDVGDDSGWPGPLEGWYGKSIHFIHNLMNEYGYTWDLLPSYGEGERFFLYTPQ